MDKKKRIILDAGENTALFVEQDSEGNYLATMYPFKESDLVLKTWKFLGWLLFQAASLSIMIGLVCLMAWSSLSHAFPDSSFIIGFVCSGIFLGSALFSKQVFLHSKKDLKDKQFVFVRDILREMKSENAEPIEQYSIKSSYLYNGMDGDFITWYKQEKNKQELRKFWRAP